MPLDKSGTPEARSKNIAELHHSDPSRPIKQDVAIAYAVERREHEKNKYGH